MGSIAFTVTNAANGAVGKTYTVADSDLADLVVAYQGDANVDINGTATRNQVLLYIAKTWLQAAQQKVKAFKDAQNLAAVPVVNPFTAS